MHLRLSTHTVVRDLLRRNAMMRRKACALPFPNCKSPPPVLQLISSMIPTKSWTVCLLRFLLACHPLLPATTPRFAPLRMMSSLQSIHLLECIISPSMQSPVRSFVLIAIPTPLYRMPIPTSLLCKAIQIPTTTTMLLRKIHLRPTILHWYLPTTLLQSILPGSVSSQLLLFNLLKSPNNPCTTISIIMRTIPWMPLPSQ
mmetsp:Transcript_5152/g.11377  ORF Transcript_5152/g.11377 Transcript_5152/m.11377 type:complete len:200 (+) Transcript_5152:674-1273(+)